MLSKIFSKKILAWAAGIALVAFLAFSGAQCRKIETLKIENMGLQQKISKLKFEVEEAKATIETHDLIRQGPKAIAVAVDDLKLPLKPKPGKTPVPSEVVKKNGITLIQVDPERLAQLVIGWKATERKQERINALDLELDKTNEFLRKARATRMRNMVVGFGVGIAVTVLVTKLIK